MKAPINVYVGYDAREHEAYEVCRYSLMKHNSDDFSVNVIPLKHQELRDSGLFYRRWVIDEEGQYWDELDGKPFSTEFSHSRFAIQEYATQVHKQRGWTMFVDCDFLFRVPVKELFKLTEDNLFCHNAVMCVKFDWTPTNTIKMDNKVQTGYPRKLWSSMMLWNLDHPSHEVMGYFKLNESNGIELHTFRWLDNSEIGEIHPRWNYVSGVTKLEDEPAAIHFSEGGPWFKGYENVEYATEWNKALGKVYVDKSSNQL